MQGVKGGNNAVRMDLYQSKRGTCAKFVYRMRCLMKSSSKITGFHFSIIATILVCVAVMAFCFIVGGREHWYLAGSDDTLFFYIVVGQIAIAIVLLIIFAIVKITRKNKLWIIVPFILIAFALLYDPILSIAWQIAYPCC